MMGDETMEIPDHGPAAGQMTPDNVSGQYFPEELSLFEQPPLMAAIASEEYVDYRPTSSGLNSGSLDYTIPMSSSQMVDLKACTHHFTFKIVHANDGSEVSVENEPMVGPVNYIGATLWDSLELYLNDTLVTPSGGHHTGYRSYLEALLDTSRFKKSSELQAGLWYPDTPGIMGPSPDEDVGNEGFKWRTKWMRGSNECSVMAPLTTDLAQQPRLILNGIQINLKFFRSRPEWHLMVARNTEGKTAKQGGYRLEITDAFLRVRKKTVVPSVLLAIERTLGDSPALYPVMRTEVRKMLCHKGQMSFCYENIFQNSVPSVLVIAFQRESASSGHYSQNALEFQHCSLSSLSCSVDDKTCGHPPMRLHFDQRSHLNSSYLDGFASLFQKESIACIDEDSAGFLSIDRDSFPRGYTLFKYVFSSAANSRFLPVVTRGNLRLSGSFSTALPENMVMITYARFPSMISVDKTRRVSY